MVTFIIERHGQSQANLDGVFAGHYDVPLTEQGISQAKKTAQYVKENYKIDKIYASDLKRAYVTAKQVAELFDIEVIPDKNLREIFAGQWEEMPFAELYKREDFALWTNQIGKVKCPKGETMLEFGERIISEFKKIAQENDGKTIFIATHATPLRRIIAHCKNIDIEDLNQIKSPSNCSITVIEYENGRGKIKLEAYDEFLGNIRTKLPANV